MTDQPTPTMAPQGGKSPDYREIYTNAVRLGIGPWDIRLICGHIVEDQPGRQVIEDVVTVVMSPQHAKTLLKHWQDTIAQYETFFGPIPDLTPKLESLAKQAAPN